MRSLRCRSTMHRPLSTSKTHELRNATNWFSDLHSRDFEVTSPFGCIPRKAAFADQEKTADRIVVIVIVVIVVVVVVES